MLHYYNQLFKVVSQNLGKAAYTALFVGSRELMTEGYEFAAVVGVPLLVLTIAYPRTLPAPPSDVREEAEVREEAKPAWNRRPRGKQRRRRRRAVASRLAIPSQQTHRS